MTCSLVASSSSLRESDTDGTRLEGDPSNPRESDRDPAKSSLICSNEGWTVALSWVFKSLSLSWFTDDCVPLRKLRASSDTTVIVSPLSLVVAKDAFGEGAVF